MKNNKIQIFNNFLNHHVSTCGSPLVAYKCLKPYTSAPNIQCALP